MIISISGLASSGKDTIGSILINNFNFKRIAMADALKELTAKVMDLPLETFHDVTLKDKPFKIPYVFDNELIANLTFELNELGYNIIPSAFQHLHGEVLDSPRKALIFIGTDVCRNYVDKNIWLDLTMKNVLKTEGHIVITDARFKNERDALKAIGALKMFVDRPEITRKFDPTKAHESELDQLRDDYDIQVLNNGPIHLLHKDITTWYTARIKAW